MNGDYSQLHAILKDPIRRRILLLLWETDGLTHTELMKALELENTGKLNYHLKLLRDLIEKEDGKYKITQKGKLAANLLQEFPETKTNHRQINISKEDSLFVIVFNGLYFAIILLMYFNGYIRDSFLIAQVVLFAVSVSIIFIIAKRGLPQRPYNPQRMMTGYKFGYIMLGIALGIAITFVAGGLILLGAVSVLRWAGIRVGLFDFFWWLIISPIIGSVFGAIGGYLKFKKSKYSRLP